MMKKMIGALCVLLCTALLLPAAATAAQIPASDPMDEIYAVVDTAAGERIVEGAAAASLGEVGSYELYIEDEAVLSVKQTASTGAVDKRYYIADFMLPGTTKNVVLAGLTAGKVDEIRDRIISEYQNGTQFTLSDLSFIDTEKTWKPNDGDDNLCWAAASSNVLQYTGWGALAGFDSEDAVFDAFVQSFTNYGGSAYNIAFAWFFNGLNLSKYFPRIAQATEGTGAYLTDYAFEMLADSYGSVSDGPLAMMKGLCSSLRNGGGAVLSVGLWMEGDLGYHSNHAITCWGFVADTAYDEDDLNYYAGVFFADSDNDEPTSGDRSGAPNVIKAAAMAPGYAREDGYLTMTFPYSELSTSDITGVTTLAPYTADTPKETDSAATRNRMTTPDFFAGGLLIGTDFSSVDYTHLDFLESGQPFYCWPEIYNMSDIPFGSYQNNGDGVHFDVRFTDASGSDVWTVSYDCPVFYIGRGISIEKQKDIVRQSGLPEGDYTVTLTVNADRAVTEAYCYNNEYTMQLKVRDRYRLGDANNNGKIDILDATAIQRALCASAGPDAKLTERCAVTGDTLSILDATVIQRVLAGFTEPYEIGKQFYYA